MRMSTRIPRDDARHALSTGDASTRHLFLASIKTSLVLALERFFPPLLLSLGVVSAFITFAWLGVFTLLEPWARAGLSLAFLAALAFTLRPLLRLHLPNAAEIAARLDQSRPTAHRPLATLADKPANLDALASTLWAAHQARAAAAAATLAAPKTDARLRFVDGHALRWLAVLALILAGTIAGEERVARLTLAFDWSTPRIPPVPPRLDAWVDPPAYTARPPLFLTAQNGIAPANGEVVRVPVGSTLTVRLTVPEEQASKPGAKPPALVLEAKSGLNPIVEEKKAEENAPPAAPAKRGIAIEKRIVAGDSVVNIRKDGQNLGQFTLAVIPDLAPKVVLSEARAETPSPDQPGAASIRIIYTLEDDYGIAKAEVRMEPTRGVERTLFPAPTATLPLRIGANETTIPTQDHPWAGEEVRLTLHVEDDLGQKAQSGSLAVTLPGRAFTQAIPKALVEQRRTLVFAPEKPSAVSRAFDALLFAPDVFTPNVAEFMALDILRVQLRNARTEERLRAVAEAIYETALTLENGDMTEAERRLREAEERLREALERDAPADEIRRLAEDLRRAMDQYLREFAENALKNRDQNAQERPLTGQERMLTQRDLADLLRKVEEMARSGDTAGAQQLLNQLKDILNNLRTARRQESDQRSRELSEQLRELDQLQREQRDLKDRTFQNQQRRQQGQNQRGQRQPGQQGEPGEDGEQSEGGQSLQQQQQALQERLRQLRERMRQRGQQQGEGLDEAEDGMGDAQNQLGQGQPGSAMDGQQRALDGMGRAAQGMAQALQRQMGQGEGEGEGEGLGQPGPGQRGRADNRADPLGRPQPNTRRDAEDSSRVQVPDKDQLQGSISERAARVLQELRRRLGDFERPREELDYLERLLRQR